MFGYYLLFACSKCHRKYGALPEICQCGCMHFYRIEPEYESLIHK